MTPLSNAQLVMRVGEALHGPYAVDRLSRELPMAKRTVERIAAAAQEGGEYAAAKGALTELPRLINARIRELEAWKAYAVSTMEAQGLRS
ncbi:hypothetical protein [Brevundimonas sp.]|uniref:hypothetical protein n=1 Tax=Brevundimonas sp. TaxID=1871086 RepID=UPI002613C72A|nr:hypothetical protein [Brevundimonas sp.]